MKFTLKIKKSIQKILSLWTSFKPGETTEGNVGPPFLCCMYKLIDVPDMNLNAKEHNKGEVKYFEHLKLSKKKYFIIIFKFRYVFMELIYLKVILKMKKKLDKF